MLNLFCSVSQTSDREWGSRFFAILQNFYARIKDTIKASNEAITRPGHYTGGRKAVLQFSTAKSSLYHHKMFNQAEISKKSSSQ
jgi:hypothetical protein